MAFSATEAAFEGFRLVRRNPMALIAWTVLYALFYVAALFALGPVMEQLFDWQTRAEALDAAGPPAMAEAWALMAEFGQILLPLAWLLPVALVVEAMLAAAIARGVLAPKGGAVGYLRLGMDEVRVLVVTFVLSLLMSLLVFVLIMVVMIGAGAAQAAGSGALMGLIAALGVLAAVALLVWLSVRLCLAVPITVAEKRFAFFDSFRMTKGRFWPLLGMAIIAFVMVMVIELLSSIISMPVGMMSGLETWSFNGQSDPEALLAALNPSNPWVIASVVVEAVVKALTVGVLYAPFAAAYRDLKAG